MQELLLENSLCADCGGGVTGVDVTNGVFLCQSCAPLHTELNWAVKTCSASFTPEEVQRLKDLGNHRVNEKLCRAKKPWIPSPTQFPFHAVRRFWVRAKYLHLSFSGLDESRRPRHSLDEYWFFLDEVSGEKTTLQGPMAREELREAVRVGEKMRPESFVWHPVLGAKWVALDKLHKRMLSCEGASDQDEVYRFYEVRCSLAAQPSPLLRGLLDVQIRGKVVRRWVMLINVSLYFSVLSQSISIESVTSISELNFDLYERESRICIKALSATEEFSLWGQSGDETLEWFVALRLAKHMIDVLGFDDFPFSDNDASEQHACNVRTSANYMGRKVKEGQMRKEGSNWRTVKSRWFVLRTQALYYYKTSEDKVHLGHFPLKGARTSSFEQYRYANHVAVVQGQKVLHLWMDDAIEKERWVAAIQSVIDQLNEEVVLAGISQL